MSVWLRMGYGFDEEAAADREYHASFSPSQRVATINELLRDWDRMNNRPLTPNRDFVPLFARLNEREARYLIVGTYAFAFHLKARYTATLDLLIESPDSNLTHPHVIVRRAIHGVTFAEAWETRVAGEYEGIPVHYLGREALMRNKAAAGRPQDLADLAALR